MEQLDDMHEFENDAKRKAYSEEEFIELLETEGL